jgi:hypothetical protein
VAHAFLGVLADLTPFEKVKRPTDDRDLLALVAAGIHDRA